MDVDDKRLWKRPGVGGSGIEVVDWTAIAGDIVTDQAAAVLEAAAVA